MDASLTTNKLRGTQRIKTHIDPDAAFAQASGDALPPLGTVENPSNQIFTIANIFTFCRFLLTVAFLILFVDVSNRQLALFCYSLAAVTDFFDGQIARHTQTVSWLGKIMDPIMDRVLLFTGVLGLMIIGDIPVWIAVFVLGRDIYLAIGVIILQKYRRRPIDVAFIGKVTTATFMIGFCDLLLGVPEVPGLGIIDSNLLPGLDSETVALGIWFIYVGIVCSTATAVIYTKEGFFLKHEAIAGHNVETAEAGQRAREAVRVSTKRKQRKENRLMAAKTYTAKKRVHERIET